MSSSGSLTETGSSPADFADVRLQDDVQERAPASGDSFNLKTDDGCSEGGAQEQVAEALKRLDIAPEMPAAPSGQLLSITIIRWRRSHRMLYRIYMARLRMGESSGTKLQVDCRDG